MRLAPARVHEGAIAGAVGGVVGAAWALLVSPVLGTDVLAETRLAAVPLLGDSAMQPGNFLLALVVGGTSHMAVSIAWGVVYALTVRAASPLVLIGAGPLFGIVVWRAMYDLVLPALGSPHIVQGFSTARAMTEHVVFGTGVGLGLFLVRRARTTLAS